MRQGSNLLQYCVFILHAIAITQYYYFGSGPYAIRSTPDIGEWCILFNSLTEDTYTKLTIATRLCAISADIFILVVTWRNTYATKREANQYGIETPLATMLLRDGTLYFVLLLCLNVLNMAGTATNVFNYSAVFSTPISSIIISHFLLNLRQLVYTSHNDELNSRPSFVLSQYGSPNGSQSASLRFASFVDNMGEDLNHGFGDTDPSLEWHVSDGDANAEVGSSLQSELEAVQNSTSASGLRGSHRDVVDAEKVHVTDMQRIFDQNMPKLEDTNGAIATDFEMDEHKLQGVDVV